MNGCRSSLPFWNQERFAVGRDDEYGEEDGEHEQGGGEGGGGRFDPAEISRLIRDGPFRAYLKMAIVLDQATEELAAWAERCVCHEHPQAQYSSKYVPVSVLRSEFGGEAAAHVHLTCPMRGRRAPEVAAGGIFEHMSVAWSDALSELTAACRPYLTHQQWSAVLLEFNRGKSHCAYIIILKLQNWEQLPWMLCGLAHCNEDTARSIAMRAIAQYDQARPGGAAVEAAIHHRVSHKFLSPGCLREQLEAFANNAGGRAEFAELYTEIAQLRFIPITERSIEEPHSRIKRAITYRNHGPLSVTLTARGTEVERTIADESSAEAKASSMLNFEALSKHISEVISVRKIPHMLEMGLHPWLRVLAEGHEQTSKWVTLLSCILYRCDDASQFESFQA